MDAPRLTVIVTCYNLAPFLPACLQSIFRQPHADRLRVLIIDDGSQDSSREVAQAQMSAHPEVDCHLITQPNQGVSGARNTGIRRVTTPYLTFLDADDRWADNYLEQVLPIVDAGHADIIAFNARFVDMTGRRVQTLRPHRRTSGPGGASCAELAADAAAVGEWHTYTRIVRTRLLDGIWFPAGRCYEDAAVMPLLYARAARIVVLDQELYVYVRRPGSLTSAVSDQHIDDLLMNARQAAARLDENPAFWRAVCHRTLMQVAAEIGRATPAARRAMLQRAWPQVRLTHDLRLQATWLLRLLDGCLRSAAKHLLGRIHSRARAHGPGPTRAQPAGAPSEPADPSLPGRGISPRES